MVLTRDQYDPAGELVEGRVSQVFQTTAYGVHILELQDEETGNVETIKATAEHPFYVEGQGWLAAEHLSLGMRVQNPDGTWSVVQANTYEAREQGVTVYNFEVEGGHTYFVADDQGDVSAVWVHNRCNRELRRALGLKRGDAEQAAHVVPVGAFKHRADRVRLSVRTAQAVLDRHRIDIGGWYNGFRTLSTRHNGTHTDAYLRSIGGRLRDAELNGDLAGARGRILNELNALKLEALSGRW